MANLVFPIKQYKLNPQTEHAMLTILAGGSTLQDIQTSSIPGHDSFYLLVYTRTGQAILRTGSCLVQVPAPSELSGSLLLLSCDRDYYVQKISSDWSGAYFLLSDSYFCRLPFSSRTENPLHITLPADSKIPGYFQLLAQGQTDASLHSKLYDHKLLTSILCDALLLLPAATEPPKPPASYLIRMKQILDEGYAFPHSLAEFESLFDISRYRLCREFTKVYGDSPMQYLNKLRIEKSLQLLRDTDLNIRETGSAVGIENTNHFINLFKKYTGKTPLAYRQEV